MDRTLFRGVKHYFALPDADRWLFLRAFIALGAIDVALRVGGFRRMVAGAQPALVSARCPVKASELYRARRYAYWLDVASRHHLVRARCLHRSLALHRWLRREGLPSEFRIGVRKQGDSLQAHAWVELGGCAVDDGLATLARFTPLADASGQSVHWAPSRGRSIRSLVGQPISAAIGELQWD